MSLLEKLKSLINEAEKEDSPAVPSESGNSLPEPSEGGVEVELGGVKYRLSPVPPESGGASDGQPGASGNGSLPSPTVAPSTPPAIDTQQLLAAIAAQGGESTKVTQPASSTPPNGPLTNEAIEKMTLEQINQNWDKISAQMDSELSAVS